MLASAKDETMQLAEEKLQTIAKQANDNVEVAPVEEEAHGFLGKFNSNMNEVINADDLAKQEAEKAQKKVELSAQITTEFAPKLAESAIAEALVCTLLNYLKINRICMLLIKLKTKYHLQTKLI